MNKKKRRRFTEAFKTDAVLQVTERGYSVSEVAKRLGVSPNTLYKWKAKYSRSTPPRDAQSQNDVQLENAKLKAEVRRLTEERDILKKAAAYFAKQSP